MKNNSGFGTKAIHAGQSPDPITGAIMQPLIHSTTFVQESPGKHSGFEYSRTGNPTRKALEANLAALENCKFGVCFASGMAAIDAIVKTLKPGDHVLATNDLYGGTYRLFTRMFSDFGIKFDFVDLSNLEEAKSMIHAETKMIWVETPTNPLCKIIDIEAVCKLANENNILVAVDNTFATPYIQNPVDLGADMVMHSVTKYLAGHSDVVMGSVCTNNETLAEKLAFIQNTSGAVPSPQDCYLVLRGTKTLHVRMDRHCSNAEALADFLKSHSKVEKVFYPGLQDHKNHDVAARQMKFFGGMISFSLVGGKTEDAFKFLENVHVFSLAESLGGVESLAGHPATMTHASIPKEERLKAGLTDSTIRLSVGIEDLEDLQEDLRAALELI